MTPKIAPIIVAMITTTAPVLFSLKYSNKIFKSLIHIFLSSPICRFYFTSIVSERSYQNYTFILHNPPPTEESHPDSLIPKLPHTHIDRLSDLRHPVHTAIAGLFFQPV